MPASERRILALPVVSSLFLFPLDRQWTGHLTVAQKHLVDLVKRRISPPKRVTALFPRLREQMLSSLFLRHVPRIDIITFSIIFYSQLFFLARDFCFHFLSSLVLKKAGIISSRYHVQRLVFFYCYCMMELFLPHIRKRIPSFLSQANPSPVHHSTIPHNSLWNRMLPFLCHSLFFSFCFSFFFCFFFWGGTVPTFYLSSWTEEVRDRILYCLVIFFCLKVFPSPCAQM